MVPVRPLTPGPKAHYWFQPSRVEPPLELQSVGFNPDQEPVDRPKGYPCYHWLQTEFGTGEVLIGPQRLTLGPGQGILLPPKLPHAYAGIPRPWGTRYLTFFGPVANIVVSTLGLTTSTRITWDPGASLATALARITEQFQEGRWGRVGDRSSSVYQFLGELRGQGTPFGNRGQSDRTDRLAPLLEHVEAHLSDPDLGVEAMADFLCVSPRQLNELFAQSGQASPYQYLKTRRLTRAKQLLLWYRDLGIKEVSAQVGFRDPSHFIHAFRQTTGQSPDQFRKHSVQ